jgi:hypothetical protein
MFERYNSAGYDLYQPFPELNQWVIDLKNGQAYHGKFNEVVSYMVSNLDFYFQDIEIAVKEMTDKWNNCAHFGINRTFIFSFNKEINVDQAS